MANTVAQMTTSELREMIETVVELNKRADLADPWPVGEPAISDSVMEKKLLRDGDWASIDGRLCLITDFIPLAKVENDKVLAISSVTPYGSVRLKCEDSIDDITGFITHKTDFAMLWAAFNRRTEVPGARIEVRSPELNSDGLGQNEEVWLVWTKKNYRAAAGLFSRFLPRLVVMVSQKGAFALAVDRTGQVRPELQGRARAMARLPLVTWTPEVMR